MAELDRRSKRVSESNTGKERSMKRRQNLVIDFSPPLSCAEAAYEVESAENKGGWEPIYPPRIGLQLANLPDSSMTCSWEAVALGVLARNPDWTVQQIADEVGVHRGTLYRSELFTQAREKLKLLGKQAFLADAPRGKKSLDKTDHESQQVFEAWDEKNNRRE